MREIIDTVHRQTNPRRPPLVAGAPGPYFRAMRSTDLTRQQLERIETEVERQLRYYLRMWRRVQANDMALTDPLAQGICEAWDGINHLKETIERLRRQVPEPYGDRGDR